MSIQPLSDTTARALGASQALHDPVCVVKELVENSLDAHATSISIEIHSNTLDSIVVRDNGRGIAPSDRRLVAKASCTSKIVSTDDLESVGGRTMGFRGQALASIAELSATLTISSRVEGEAVGQSMNIDRTGSIATCEPISIPPGTVVKIGHFLYAHPVRKAEHTKHAERDLKRLVSLLQSYALAKPSIRLGFRVVSTKNQKFNFSFAPIPSRDISDVARSIFSLDCPSQCMVVEDQHLGYNITALLPRADAEIAKVRGVGTFISVDGRPLASSKGFAKQILKCYHKTLQSSSLATSKDLFLVMKISCPERSYDVNIEPAKDDLLFHDIQVVHHIVQRFFEQQYPTPPRRMDARADTIVRPLEPANPVTTHTQGADVPETTNQSPEEVSIDGNASYDVYGSDIDDLDLLQACMDDEDATRVASDPQLSNPWIFAKLHAKSQLRMAGNTSSQPPVEIRGGMPTPLPSSSPLRHQPLQSSNTLEQRQYECTPRRIRSDIQISDGSNGIVSHGWRHINTMDPRNTPPNPDSQSQLASPRVFPRRNESGQLRTRNPTRPNKPFKPPSRVKGSTPQNSNRMSSGNDRSLSQLQDTASSSVVNVPGSVQPSCETRNRDIRDFTRPRTRASDIHTSLIASSPGVEEWPASGVMIDEFERSISGEDASRAQREMISVPSDHDTLASPMMSSSAVTPLTSIDVGINSRRRCTHSEAESTLHEHTIREVSEPEIEVSDEISIGTGVHNLIADLNVTIDQIVQAVDHVDCGRSLSRWGEAPIYCEHPALTQQEEVL